MLMDVILRNMEGGPICNLFKNSCDTEKLPFILNIATHNLSYALNQDGAPNDFIAKLLILIDW